MKMKEVVSENEEPEPDAKDLFRAEILSKIRPGLDLAFVNGEVRINVDNVMPIIRLLEIEPNDESILDLIREALIETRGEIDIQEFEKIVVNKLMCTHEEETECVKAAFAVADFDNDGFITGADVYKLMMGVGEMVDDDEIMSMLKAADLDGDGRISMSDFKHFMLGAAPETITADNENDVISVATATETPEEKPADQTIVESKPRSAETPAVISCELLEERARRRRLFSYAGCQIKQAVSSTAFLKKCSDVNNEDVTRSPNKEVSDVSLKAKGNISDSGMNIDHQNNAKCTAADTNDESIEKPKLRRVSFSQTDQKPLLKSEAGESGLPDSRKISPEDVTDSRQPKQVFEELITPKYVSRVDSCERSMKQIHHLIQRSTSKDVCVQDDNSSHRRVDESEILMKKYESIHIVLPKEKEPFAEEITIDPDNRDSTAIVKSNSETSTDAIKADSDSESESEVFQHDQGQQTSESSFDEHFPDNTSVDHSVKSREMIVRTCSQRKLKVGKSEKAKLLEKAILLRSSTVGNLLRDVNNFSELIETVSRSQGLSKSAYIKQDYQTVPPRMNIVDVTESIEKENVYGFDKTAVKVHHGFSSIRPLARVIMALNRTRSAAMFTSVSRQLEESNLVSSWDDQQNVVSDVVSVSPGKTKQGTSVNHVISDAKSSPLLSRKKSAHVSDCRRSLFERSNNRLRPNSSPLITRTSHWQHHHDVKRVRCKSSVSFRHSSSNSSYDSSPEFRQPDNSDSLLVTAERASVSASKHSPVTDKKHTKFSCSRRSHPADSAVVYLHLTPKSLGDDNETVISNEFRTRRANSSASCRRNTFSRELRLASAPPVSGREFKACSPPTVRKAETARPAQLLLNLCFPSDKEYKPNFVRTSTLTEIPTLRSAFRKSPFLRSSTLSRIRIL